MTGAKEKSVGPDNLFNPIIHEKADTNVVFLLLYIS